MRKEGAIVSQRVTKIKDWSTEESKSMLAESA